MSKPLNRVPCSMYFDEWWPVYFVESAASAVSTFPVEVHLCATDALQTLSICLKELKRRSRSRIVSNVTGKIIFKWLYLEF